MDAKPDPLQSLLEQLQVTGKLESSGSFTLDAARAHFLLEKFQLPTPAYCMLHVVAAAVCSQSTEVRIGLRADRFEVTYDGIPFQPEDIERCFASLWLSARDVAITRLRELAIGRSSASDWSADSFVLAQAKPGFYKIQMRRPGWIRQLTRLLGRYGRLDDEALLSSSLVSTPSCNLFLNAKRIQAIETPSEVMTAVTLQSEFRPGRQPSVLARRSAKTIFVKDLNWASEDQRKLLEGAQALMCQLLPDQISPAIWKGQQKAVMKTFWPGYVDVVQAGRLYRCQLPPSLANCWGIFFVFNLKRDLSQTSIAREDLDFLIRLLETELTGCS
jgi:hypothetical protein